MCPEKSIYLNEFEDLRRYEAEVLQTISLVPHGALLFLSDPERFLLEHGFSIGEPLRKFLHQHADNLQKASPGSYDEIKAGKAKVCEWNITMRSLGLPPKEAA